MRKSEKFVNYSLALLAFWQCTSLLLKAMIMQRKVHLLLMEQFNKVSCVVPLTYNKCLFIFNYKYIKGTLKRHKLHLREINIGQSKYLIQYEGLEISWIFPRYWHFCLFDMQTPSKANPNFTLEMPPNADCA